MQYDLFLCHNSSDKEFVRAIKANLLKKQDDLRIWFDESELPPGTRLGDTIEGALRESKAIAVFIGTSGMGPWQTDEFRAAETLRRDRAEVRIIPVLLAPDSDPQEILKTAPLFLRDTSYVSFRNPDDAAALGSLMWAVTDTPPGERKRESSPPPAEPEKRDHVQEAVFGLAQAISGGDVTIFMGFRTHGIQDSEVDAHWDLARELLEKLDLIDADYDQLLPTADTAAYYYAIKKYERELEDHVATWIAHEQESQSAIHDQVAQLLLHFSRRRLARARRRTRSLIITTGYDILTERALLRAGVPFMRVIQHRDGEKIETNDYTDVSVVDGRISSPSMKGSVPIDDLDAVDELIKQQRQRSYGFDTEKAASIDELLGENLRAPILYKYNGSVDVPDSCAISTNQYYTFACKVLETGCIPVEVSEIISNNPMLILGCSILDTSFLLTYYTLLRKPLRASSPRRYAVLQRPDVDDGPVFRKLQSKIWDAVKQRSVEEYKINVVEDSPADFVGKLRTHLDSLHGG